MWCTRHSAHVSSTYSLVASITGVGIASVGASKVNWGWSKGQGLGAIFAGLVMAPVASGCFGAIIFSLIKYVVHVRKEPIRWAVFTSPFFFLIACTISTLSIVYKGSPNLGLDKKPAWFIASVTLGVGFGMMFLSGLFFVPYTYCKVINRDYTLRIWHIWQGPMLFWRPRPEDSDMVVVPNYAVIQHAGDPNASHEGGLRRLSSTQEATAGETITAETKGSGDATADASDSGTDESQAPAITQQSYKKLLAQAREAHHAELRKKKGPLGWAMRSLHANPMGEGAIYETHNLAAAVKRVPAMVVVAALYGLSYDIHAAQVSRIGAVPRPLFLACSSGERGR